MCDVQLLAGTGILLSGYIGLHCFISSYHWQLVVYLAWFSNLTHIACLTALRSYLHQHQLERNWRLFFMTVLWASLITAIVPTAFFNWPNWDPTSSLPWSNARCFFDLGVARALYNETVCFVGGFRTTENGPDVSCWKNSWTPVSQTGAAQSAIVSILLLAFSYFSRMIKLTKRLSDSFHMIIRRRTSDRYTKRLTKRINKLAANQQLSVATRRAQNLVYVKARIALYLVVKMYADMLTSDASDVSSISLLFFGSQV